MDTRSRALSRSEPTGIWSRLSRHTWGPFSAAWFFVGPVPIAVAGQVTVPLPLPGPAVLPQANLFLQVFMKPAAAGWTSSNGLTLKTSLP